MNKFLRRVLATLLVPFMVLLNCPLYAAQTASEGETAEPTTKVIHKPAKELVAGKRVAIYAEVEDPKGVELVRVYFKAMEGATYNFVPMEATEVAEKGMWESFKQMGSDFKGEAYSATLPAPANGAQQIEYLLLVKNIDNIVVKTQTYTLSVVDSEEEVAEYDPIKVYTEMSEIPQEMTGFTDNIAFDVVESTAKLGVVAGLYSTMTTGGGSAVSGGTIAASAGGMTTTAAVVGSLAAIAAVGVGAAAGGGGGGGGGGESSGSSRSSNNVCAENYPQRACDLINGATAHANGSCSNLVPPENIVQEDWPPVPGPRVSCVVPPNATVNL